MIYEKLNGLLMSLPYLQCTLICNTDYILENDTFDLLKETGLKGSILHTPGHSADSISLLLADGSAFVGDAAMNMPPVFGTKHRPIFIQNMTSVYKSWKKLISSPWESLSCSNFQAQPLWERL